MEGLGCENMSSDVTLDQHGSGHEDTSFHCHGQVGDLMHASIYQLCALQGGREGLQYSKVGGRGSSSRVGGRGSSSRVGGRGSSIARWEGGAPVAEWEGGAQVAGWEGGAPV